MPLNKLEPQLTLMYSPLADVHPTEFAKTLFPGQDYNNARYEDFKNVNNYLTNEFSILDQPRMPWEDVSCLKHNNTKLGIDSSRF